jgi:hypothetical protein
VGPSWGDWLNGPARLNLTLDDMAVGRIVALLDVIEDPRAMGGERRSDQYWERREHAIGELAELLRGAVMER